MAQLLSEYEKPVYNAACRMLGNVDDAADVTQTVFLKAFENIDKFDPGRRFFSWLYRIAVNETLDRLRRRERQGPMPEEPAAETGSPTRATAEAQVNDALQAALAALSEENRTVIVLRYFVDLDYRQIAITLDIPEKTVKSRLFTARQQLKKRLIGRGVDGS